MNSTSSPAADPDYFTRYKNFAHSRSASGVLNRFHTDDGPHTVDGGPTRSAAARRSGNADHRGGQRPCACAQHLTNKYMAVVFRQRISRRLAEGMLAGTALECVTAASLAYLQQG
jgi:hypothetical protein